MEQGPIVLLSGYAMSFDTDPETVLDYQLTPASSHQFPMLTNITLT